MPTINELSTAKTELNAALTEGLDDISRFEVVTFTKYVRRVLPLDGFVFWLNTALVNDDGKPTTQPVKGYIHLTTDSIQEEEQLYDRNSVIFTAQSKIDNFNETGGDELYIGEFYGVRFAFSRRYGWNDPANLYHYSGHAIYPQMASQIIDSADDIDINDVVVSSSLPIWLNMRAPGVPLYPAMLSPDNFLPPFATVKCSMADSLASSYFLDKNSNQSQLVSEEVKISFTGLRNAAIMDFVRYVTEYTLSDDAELGIMNIPVVQDERVPQNELNVLAQRKTITFKVNYYQARVREVARKLILKAIPNLMLSKK